MSPRFRAVRPAPGARGTLSVPLADPFFAEALFDCIPDIVFFVKNEGGAYVVVNDTLARRCGVQSKAELIGRTSRQVFPAPLGESYEAQDRQVLAGRTIRDRLELHLYPDGGRGWCLTHKLPLRGPGRRIVAIAGISRDLHRPDERREDYRAIAQAIEHLQRAFGEPLRAPDLARIAGMPAARFERAVRRIFQLTPGQLLIKTRLDAATRLLGDSAMSIAEIAQECGYCDQSAFTRQFKAAVGLTPRRFREASRVAVP